MAFSAPNPIAGVSPIGKLTVTAATPLKLNTNVGVQGQAANKFASRFKQLSISALKANTDEIYIVFGNNGAVATPNAILCAISPGQTVTLPGGALLQTAALPFDSLYLDGLHTGDAVVGFVCWG